ncbi:hypothetical protein YC2023_113687 [Brassica napus]
MPTDASTSEENERNPCDIGTASNIVKGAKHNEKRKGKMKQSEVEGDDYDADKHNKKKKGKMKQDEVEGDDYDADKINSEKENREKLAKRLQLLLCPGARLLLWRREPRSSSVASSVGSFPASSLVIPAASKVFGARQQEGSMRTAVAVYHLMVVLQNQTDQYMVDQKKKNHDDVLKLVEEACKELQQEA